MKKTITTALLAIVLGFAILFATGCKFDEWLLTPTGEAIVKKAGKVAGLVTGFENVAKINEMIEKCDALLLEKEEALKEAAIQTAYKYVYARYGHNVQTAMLLSEASEIIGIVLNGNKLEFLDGYNTKSLDMFIVAFRNGLSLATPKHGRFIRRN